MSKIPETIKEVMVWKPSYHNRKSAILYCFNRSTKYYLIAGLLLCEAEDKKDWRHDGSCALNFFQWVENELGIKRSSAQRLMAIWKAFKDMILEQEQIILSVDSSKLALIAPYMHRLPEEKKIELLHSAQHLSVRALTDTVRELDGKIPSDMCEHEGAKEIWYKCKKCQKFFR